MDARGGREGPCGRGVLTSRGGRADLSGIVVGVGADVQHVRPGDRVLGAAPQVRTGALDHGAFQAFALTKAATTAKLPPATGLADAAALVTGVAAAVHTLVDVFGLDRAALERPAALPPVPAPGGGPALLVWGGASNVGLMTIQLARLAGLRVVAAAGARHHDYLRALGAAAVVDYRAPTAVRDLAAAAGAPFAYVADAIATPDTLQSCLAVLAQAPAAAAPVPLCHTLPWPPALAVPAGVAPTWVRASDMWSRTGDLAVWLFHRALPAWLERGLVQAPPLRLVEGGVAAVQEGLNAVKEGTSAEKVVVAL